MESRERSSLGTECRRRSPPWTALACVGALLCAGDVARAEAGDTLAKLRQDVDELRRRITLDVEVPVGTIMAFGGDVGDERAKQALADQGWLPCDGSLLSSSEYQELYESIGTAFGGDKDARTFNVPDLRGRFVRGVSSGSKNDASADARQASAPGGNKGNAVGSVQDDAFQGHAHATNAIDAAREGNWGGGAGSKPKGEAAFVGEPVALPGPGGKEIYGKPRVSDETRPKNVYVSWIMKAKRLRNASSLTKK